MAKAWRTAGGGFGFRANALEERMDGAVPADAAAIVEFDELTNAALVQDIRDNKSLFAVTAGGVLEKSGVPSTIAADGPQAAVLDASFGVRLKADRSTTADTFQNVVGLSFQLEANRHYAFAFDGVYHAQAGTVGLWLALNGPAFSFMGGVVEIATSTTAWQSQAFANYDVGPQPTGSGGATPLPWHIYGTISTTAAGLLIVRGRSEVNGSNVTIRQGSFGKLDRYR